MGKRWWTSGVTGGAVCALAVGACSGQPGSAPSASGAVALSATETARSASLDRFLPETRAPFVAGAMVRGDGWARRGYSRGELRIDVTVVTRATTPSRSDVGYEEWLRQVAGYPRATLDVPDGAGIGFYSCDGDGEQARCDLHVQLRNGAHVEVMGNGRASRADLEELAQRLPLRALAAAPPVAATPE